MSLTRTSVLHHDNKNLEECEKVAAFMKIAGLIGLYFGINGGVRLIPCDVTFPYVSTELANHLPLGIYKGVFAPLLVLSSFIVAYYHLGITVDNVIDWIKTFPRENLSWEEIKNWLSTKDITQGSDLLASIFGLVMSGIFVGYNIESDDPFFLLFHAEKGVPDWLMIMMAAFFISGSLSNMLTYFTEGVMQGIRYIMHCLAWIEPDIELLPSILFRSNIPNPNNARFANAFTTIGAGAGFGFGISAAIRLENNDLDSFPYVSDALAGHLPLGVHRSWVPFLTGGIFAKQYSALGEGLDISINAIRTFPWKGSYKDKKEWVFECKAKNILVASGSAAGLGLAIAFICLNATTDDPFSLPFGAEKGVPNPFLQMGALFFISGLIASAAQNCALAFEQLIKGPCISLRSIGSKVKDLLSFSIFSNNNTTNPPRVNVAPPPPAPQPRFVTYTIYRV